METEKVCSMLGLARRAGKLYIGRDSVIAAVRKRSVGLVLLTADASPRHRQELDAIGYAGDTVELPCTMEELAIIIGKKCCIFALADENFISAIKK